jgi:mannose-6-phosphate isomerase-like protein (cupin superfamily)
MPWVTRHVDAAPEVTAPDGSLVRILAGCSRGSMARFTLPAGAVSVAVAHRTVEELWVFTAGQGRMWRRGPEGTEEIVAVGPGLSLSIPAGTRFQFRADGAAPLVAIAVTMPPWPGEHEAYAVDGCWPATIAPA